MCRFERKVSKNRNQAIDFQHKLVSKVYMLSIYIEYILKCKTQNENESGKMAEAV